MKNYTTAAAKNLRDLRDLLAADDDLLRAARVGEHGPVAAFAADEFNEALRTVERRELAANAALQSLIAEAQGELAAGEQGHTRNPTRFSATSYAMNCAAVERAAAQAMSAGRVLSGVLGVTFNGANLADLV